MRAGMAEMTEYERAQVCFEMSDYAQAARLLEPFAAEQPRSIWRRPSGLQRPPGPAPGTPPGPPPGTPPETSPELSPRIRSAAR